MWITLTGFMGCGKTSVAHRLGAAMECRVVSLDDLAVQRTGLSIPEIFERDGEGAFRELESSLLRELESEPDLILDAGGGLLENLEAGDLIRNRGVVIWLDAPWEQVRDRLSGSEGEKRPLVGSLGWSGLQDLYRKRTPVYARVADFRIRSEEARPEDLARLIQLRMRSWNRPEERS